MEAEPGAEESAVRSDEGMHADLTTYYSAYCHAGMVDLSRSNGEPAPLTPAFEGVPWAAVRPPGGIVPLRAAVAAHCYRLLGPEDILLCSGASEALVATALALARRGCTVVALPGTYPSFTATLRTLGAHRRRAFDSCTPPACALATNPAVPSGHRLDVVEFISQARAAGAVPIVDEVHRHIVLDGAEAPAAAADLDPAAVSIGDLSKPLGLAGLRVGWIATRNRSVRERIERVLQLITGGPSVLADIAALAAFAAFDQYVQEQRARALCNAPLVYDELRREGWRFSPPHLGLTFAASPPAPLDRNALGRARAAGFFLLPCSVLDVPNADRALRISVLAEPADLHAALRLLIAPPHADDPARVDQRVLVTRC
jgi:aspartate/methionine/tyrosine aminotransferase